MSGGSAPNKIYVGNLSWNTTDEVLRQAFGPYGQIVDVIVMKEPQTGRSRGFGFVTFGSQAEADNAIATMNDQELDGRRLRVNVANQRPSGGSGVYNSGYSAGGYGGQSNQPYGQAGYGDFGGAYGQQASGGYGGGDYSSYGGGGAYGQQGAYSQQGGYPSGGYGQQQSGYNNYSSDYPQQGYGGAAGGQQSGYSSYGQQPSQQY